MHPNLLDQLQMFVTAADIGSFSGTARHLGRAQNVVSYGVSTLESVLNVQLFDRSGHKAVLTEAGQALLREAQVLTNAATDLQKKAIQMSAGLESFLEIAVDELVPFEVFEPALIALDNTYPNTELRLIRATSIVARDRVLKGRSSMAICGGGVEFADARDVVFVGYIEMIPVVVASDPGDIDLRDRRQIVLSSMEAPEASPDRGVFSARIWRVQDLETKFRLIRAGLGWGMMPEHLVSEALDNGEFVRLAIKQFSAPARMPIMLLERAEIPLGPAGQLFRQHIVEGSAT